MKNRYRPILFSTEMVQRILDETKTQTRRTTKLDIINDEPNIWMFKGFEEKTTHDGYKSLIAFFKTESETLVSSVCPYGNVGDILWVRETFFEYKTFKNKKVENSFYYKTDYYELMAPYLKHINKKWTPSIHMPKRVARIFLKIKKIKVERLQDISESDSIAEGCYIYGPFGEFKGSLHPNGEGMRYRAYSKARRAFQCIWQSINGETDWRKNPWVWVVEFERIDKPEDFLL